MKFNNVDLTSLVTQFWREGFIVIEDFFESAKMLSSQKKIMAHYGNDPEFLHDENFINASKAAVIPWFPQREGYDFFDDVENQHDLVDLTEAILGPGWSSQYCMVMFSKQGTLGQAWHQDCPPEDSSLFNLNRLVYTMDVTPETGGEVFVLPGSHKRGALTDGPIFEDFPDQVKVTPQRGTLILLHGHCWHRIGEIKGRYRVSTNFRAAPSGVPEDITDVCVYRNMRYRFSTASFIS